VTTERTLSERARPRLSDGTSVGDLVDRARCEVSMRVLADPEIHRLELQRIFARSWVALAHASEIPNPGDFVLRYIGEDAVIVTRAATGEVSALLNVCAHRGMEVCWADEGNQSQFKCPYHGWVFDASGGLLGAPFEQEMYGDWDKAQYGLRTAHVEIRHDVVFANFAPDPPSLEDYLGDAAWYFDLAYGQAEMEAIGPPRRTMIPANWKTFNDQLMGDGYHTISLHTAVFDMGFLDPPGVDASVADVKHSFVENVNVSFDDGHALVVLNAAPGAPADPAGPPLPGRLLLLGLFPASSCSGNNRIVLPDGSAFMTASLGGFVPRGVGAMEHWGITLVERSAPEAIKAAVRTNGGLYFAMTTVDDTDSLPLLQRAASGAVGAGQTMKYDNLMGEVRPTDWPGPGRVHAGYSKDDAQWAFWQRWADALVEAVMIET
jgi:nitrite reductase/ring-hydroxylating ferredoxin subunit